MKKITTLLNAVFQPGPGAIVSDARLKKNITALSPQDVL